MADILPDCMMPDGADPCLAYQAALTRIRELEAQVADLTERCIRRCRETHAAEARVAELEAEIREMWKHAKLEEPTDDTRG